MLEKSKTIPEKNSEFNARTREFYNKNKCEIYRKQHASIGSFHLHAYRIARTRTLILKQEHKHIGNTVTHTHLHLHMCSIDG